MALFSRTGVDVTLRSMGRRQIDEDVMDEKGGARLTGGYGESQWERKVETWRGVRTLKQQHQEGRAWLCLGDFNENLSNDEKVGGVPRGQAYMDHFREALSFCELQDLGFAGDMFTWPNHSEDSANYICERLDRVVANDGWCTQFPDFQVVNGDPRHSDHRPVVVATEQGDAEMGTRDTTFCFEA